MLPLQVRRIFLAALLICLAAPPLVAQEPLTWQEAHEFRAGPTPHDTLMAYWHELARLYPEVSILPLARSLQGREITLVTISREGAISPSDATRSGKAIVLVTNSVHGNEPVGKEASQLVARELVSGELRHVLDDVVVLFIPVLNPDGAVADRRTNRNGLDLNRDYVKLDSPEIRTLVTRVLNQWEPDIHVDTHNGGAEPYTLTWQGTLNPAADSAIRAYPYEHIFPRIREALRAEDYDGFDYSGPQTVDGEPVWGTTSVEPRKHHAYSGLVNTIGILLESPDGRYRVRKNGTEVDVVPSEERYRHQVRGQYLGLRTILEVAAARRAEIRALTNAARARAVRNGAEYDEDDRIVLEYRVVSRGREEVWVPHAASPHGYRLETREILVRHEPERTTTRPLGYVLPPTMSRALPVLLDHGITVYRTTEPVRLELEVYFATLVRRSEFVERHYLMDASVVRSNAEMELPAGSFYIPTAQSRGNLISYLLEPETDDNLITWGFADHLLRATPVFAGRDGDDFDARPNTRPAVWQRVPIMRLVREQPLPLVQVSPAGETGVPVTRMTDR